MIAQPALVHRLLMFHSHESPASRESVFHSASQTWLQHADGATFACCRDAVIYSHCRSCHYCPVKPPYSAAPPLQRLRGSSAHLDNGRREYGYGNEEQLPQ